MKLALCDKLSIEFPLFAFSHCRDVIAAVTNAEGMGVLGGFNHKQGPCHTSQCPPEIRVL